MAKFDKENFRRIILQIEEFEYHKWPIWLSVGILEYMYDDDIGYIDQYFHTPVGERDLQTLINHIFATPSDIYWEIND